MVATCIACVPAARGAWHQPVGGASPINESSAFNATEPSVASVGGVPYVGWSEPDGTNSEIRVARLNAGGSAWEKVADSASPINQSPTLGAGNASLADIGGVPYVAWSEDGGTGGGGPGGTLTLHVARLNSAGTAWEKVGQTDNPLFPINHSAGGNAAGPRLVGIGGVPYVAWYEFDGANFEVRVSRLNDAGTGWEEVVGGPSPINQSDTAPGRNPSLTAIGGVPYVAWTESDGTNTEVRVARLNSGGTAWEKVGQAVNPLSPINESATGDATSPSLTSIGGVPYVAWTESDGTNREVRVARLNDAGTAWEKVADSASPINQSPIVNADLPTLRGIAGVPYVSWAERDGTNDEIRVARLNAGGSVWEQVVGGASPINESPSRDALQPSLTAIGGVPYIGWSESDGHDNFETRVSRLEPEFLSRDAASSDTGATFSAQLRTFGLAYPVSFQHGASLENETTPVAAPTGQGDVVMVSQQVSGLTPSTAYAYRPVANAGVPQPRVFGPVGAFATAGTPADTPPPDAPPPDTPPGPDTAPPPLQLGGSKRQELDRFVEVDASCPTEACDATATGTLIVGGGKRSGRAPSRAFELGGATASIPAGGTRTLELRVPGRARKVGEAALKDDHKLSAQLAVSATDAAGNRSTASRRVRLK